MEVHEEGLAALVNSQNHKDKAVMEVVRAWVGLLLKYNINFVSRIGGNTAQVTNIPFPPFQVQQLGESRATQPRTPSRIRSSPGPGPGI